MVERKDRLLAALMRALENSDEQHRRAFHAHTETVGYFLGKNLSYKQKDIES